LDVLVLQDWLQPSALLFPALFGTRHFGVQFAFGQQRLLRRRQLARFDDLFDCVLNGSALLLSFRVFALVLVLFCSCSLCREW
jgi:hypothetical protein